jgi:3-phytase
MRFTIIAILLAATGCAPPPVAQLPAPGTVRVLARGETVPVGTANADAADDPAIWRNSRNPAASLIVATDKKAGLYVYSLDGRARHFLRAGQLNNVDLIERGRGDVIVVASDRNDITRAKLQLYRLQTTNGTLEPIGTAPGGSGEAYGVCLWDSSAGLYAFSVLKDGTVQQVRIDLGTSPSGTIVRTLKMATQTEGCVVDRRTGTLFVGEEGRGIWRFDARPDTPVAGTLVAAVDKSQLVADVEGLDIIPVGKNSGYLIASSQGDNSYALFSLPDLRPAGRFKVGAGRYGSTEATDGIAFHGGSFGRAYSRGLLVVQDGDNAPRAQNFKLVSWADVLAALRKGRQ